MNKKIKNYVILYLMLMKTHVELVIDIVKNSYGKTKLLNLSLAIPFLVHSVFYNIWWIIKFRKKYKPIFD